MSTVDQGLDLSPEKLFRFEDEKLAGRHAGERRGGEYPWRERTSPHEEIDFNLDSIGFAGVIFIVEVPFTQGLVVRTVLQFVAEA